jgi:cell division septation protein DedD
MTTPLDSAGNPQITERRSCGRQNVSFSSVTIGESTRGRVLNISRNGLALETDTALVNDELPNLRFKFSPYMTWVLASGRVAWRNSARNVVGIEFIGVTEEVQKKIETWIELRKELLLEPSKPAEAHHSVKLGDGSEIATAGPTPASELVDLDSENKSQPPLPSAVRNPMEATDARTVMGTDDVTSVAGITGKTLKLVGLALVAVLLLSAVLVRDTQMRKSAHLQKNEEQARVLRPPAPPSQPVPPLSSAERPTVPSSQPMASDLSPALPTPNRKPTSKGPSYVLQVAAMAHEENANALANSLRQMNFPAFVLKMPTGRFHHVFVGPYDSKDAANEVKNDLEKRAFQVIRKEWKLTTQ